MTPVKTHACPRCDDPGLGWSAFLAYTSPSNPSYSPPLSHARTPEVGGIGSGLG